jgi:translocation and assembly module TamB
MRRRLVFSLVAVLAVALLVILTLPFWLGAAARGFGASRGLNFSSYERVGYSRFVLNDVSFRRPGLAVTVSRLEAPTPVLWAWRHWRGGENPVIAERWSVEIAKTDQPAKATTTPKGWMPLRAQLHRIAAQLDRWLPRAQTGAGIVRFAGGEITLKDANWAGRELTVGGLSFRTWSVDGTVAFRETEDLLRVALKTTDGEAETKLESRGASLAGELVWNAQRATFAAQFPPAGWLPREGNLQANDWVVPAAKLKLGKTYASVAGTVRVALDGERVRASVQARGEPIAGQTAPPLAVDLRGEGTMQAFTVQALRAEIPGITARLTEPVVIERGGRLRGEGARLVIQGDLAKQPWFKATGLVESDALVASSGDTATAIPGVTFSLRGRGLTASGVDIASVDARGRLSWPRLEIEAASLIGGAGEQLALRGGWDFGAKEVIGARIEGELRRSSIARWLPKQPEFDVARIKVSAQGPLATVEHSGDVTVPVLKVSGLNPLAVGVAWRGRGVAAEHFRASAAVKRSQLIVEGAATREAVTLADLQLTQEENERLKLAAPATVRWKPALTVEALRLSGPQGTLRLGLQFGPSGSVDLAAANLSSRWFSDFLANPGPAVQLTLLALMGNWDRGPMNFSLTAGATLEMGEGRTASVNAAARGDPESVRIDALRATEGNATVVNATGRLPVTLHPGTTELLRIDERGGVVLDATAAPNAEFWQKLAAVSGVELKEPQAVARVRGEWLRPEGTIQVQAARIAFDPKKIARPIPTIEQIDVRVAAERSGVTLENFAFRVEGQPVRARGRLPVADRGWPALIKEPLKAAQAGADLQLEVPEAEVAVFAKFLPAVLAPKGRISASLQVTRGSLGGFVRLQDAATRPLGPLGVLQEISADLALDGRALLLRNVSARSGGQPVALTGRVELPPQGEPRFDLALRGENLPFVRQTGLLVRGDLDLKLQTPETGTPRLSGMVRLRDSLFLSDVRSFLPKGGAGASRRPPYFSVDTPPVNAWVLAVEVNGEQFMRLRTPVFTGVASARFRLSGTLGEPRAIGEIEIDEGSVKMPFARFEVQQGSVRLTEADPHEPVIYLRGTGRRFGYDLALEIDGRASSPNVVFTSSPALDSEQVLLMVMTGAAPANEIAVTGTERVRQLGTFVGSNLLSSFMSDGGDAERLSITSGEKISRGGKETYELEYKLTDRWSATAERNELDEFTAGLKWRVFRGERQQPARATEKKTDNAP